MEKMLGFMLSLTTLVGAVGVWSIFVVSSVPNLSGTWELTLSNGHETQMIILNNNSILVDNGLLNDHIPNQKLQLSKEIVESFWLGDTLKGLTLLDGFEQVAHIDLTTATSTTLEGTLQDNNGTIYDIRLVNPEAQEAATNRSGGFIFLPLFL